MYISIEEAKRLICEIGRKMYSKNFVTANDGNITIRVGDDKVVATPTGVSKGMLTPEMLLLVDMEGNVIEGTYKPTSELYMHLKIYQTNPKVMSTCHTHSPYLTAFSVAGIELDLSSTAAANGVVGKVPVAPYCTPGSKELVESVVPYALDYRIVNLSNHGPISWGYNPLEAWFTMEAAEYDCFIALIIKDELNGKIRPLSHSQAENLFAFHHVDRKAPSWLNCPEKTDNQKPGVSFCEYFGITDKK